MSSIRHPKLSAWERDEHEGHYQAALHSWTLKTVWLPMLGDRGYFGWEASREDDEGEETKTLTEGSNEHFVELSHAMSDAEDFARRDELRRAYETARRAEESALAGAQQSRMQSERQPAMPVDDAPTIRPRHVHDQGNILLGFVLGFFLGIIGVLIVYAFIQQPNTKKGALIGICVSLGLAILTTISVVAAS